MFGYAGGGGGGAGVGGATINRIVFEPQPPVGPGTVPGTAQDPGLVTWTATFPTLTTSAASTPIVTRVAELKITVRACPPTVALRPLAKPVPVTARLNPAFPAPSVLGVRPVNPGLWAGDGKGGSGGADERGDASGRVSICRRA